MVIINNIIYNNYLIMIILAILNKVQYDTILIAGARAIWCCSVVAGCCFVALMAFRLRFSCFFLLALRLLSTLFCSVGYHHTYSIVVDRENEEEVGWALHKK